MKSIRPDQERRLSLLIKDVNGLLSEYNQQKARAYYRQRSLPLIEKVGWSLQENPYSGISESGNQQGFQKISPCPVKDAKSSFDFKSINNCKDRKISTCSSRPFVDEKEKNVWTEKPRSKSLYARIKFGSIKLKQKASLPKFKESWTKKLETSKETKQ